MGDTPAVKTLAIGPPRGQIANVISKTSAINAKHGPFHALFVCGDFFESSDGLNAEEADLLDGKIALPIRTYILQATKRPPPRVRDLINAFEKGKRKQRDTEDQQPVKLADNLFWLGKDQVNWVPRDGPKEEQVTSDGHRIVDEDAERAGLRVAVAGGAWDAERWAKEVQGGGSAGEAATKTSDGDGSDDAYILPSRLEKLYRHPAFQAPLQGGTESTKKNTQGSAGNGGEPTSLAAARAQMKAEQNALAARTSPSLPPTVDIVLLPTWPSGISLFAPTFPPQGVPDQARTWGLPPLAEVMRRARPRYAFAIAPEGVDAGSPDTGVFWEREPYTTTDGASATAASTSASGSNATPVPSPSSSSSSRTTRFISLANFGNAKKVRWFVALNLAVGKGAAAAAANAGVVKGATPSPFGEFHARVGTKRKAGGEADGDDSAGGGLSSEVNFRWQQRGGGGGKKPRSGQDGVRDDGPPPDGYVCKICGSSEHYIRLCPHKSGGRAGGASTSASTGLPNRPEGAEEALGPLTRREPIQMVGPQDCWFCLSNTGCAKHLVVAIGQESYLALPKGQLPPASSEASPVPGGGHVLIVPVTHTNSVATATNATLAAEMEEYLQALSRCYAAHGCVLVAWSIVKHSNTRAGHLQIQAVPVPEERIRAAGGGSFEDALRHEGAQRGYQLEEVTDPSKQKLGSADPKAELFELHILNAASTRRITYRLDLSPRQQLRFDYQFARNTLAHYLGVPDRADWRRCAKSEKVEEVETRSFRECFREWMPEFGGDDSDDGDEE